MRLIVAIVLITSSLQTLQCLDNIRNARLNYFDIDLLRCAAEDKRGNVMISPASIRSTLALLLEGAEGQTAEEIRTALRLSPQRDDFREELKMFLQRLETNTSTVFLHSANALFTSNKYKLKKEYEMTAERVYFSEIKPLNFDDPQKSAEVINKWVSERTNGLIDTIVDQAHLTPTTQMMVTNALYFKSVWLHAFEAKLTHGECFYLNGVCRTVAMMDLEAELKYAYLQNLRAHALELPYQDSRYSMLLLVPQDRDALSPLIRDLPYIGLPEISKRLLPTDIILSLPKFSIDYSEDMVGSLGQMRIKSLFSPNANLTGIFDSIESPHINSFYHTVHMTVDEVGTVAAAATAAMVIPLINNQVQLRVDRPFLFFIRDNEQGLILFEGKIDEPTEYIDPDTVKATAKPPASQSKPELPVKPQASTPQPELQQRFKPQVSESKPELQQTVKPQLITTAPPPVFAQLATTSTVQPVDSSDPIEHHSTILRKKDERSWFTRLFSG